MALHTAANFGNVEEVRSLLDNRRLNINERDNNWSGNTPLICAVQGGHLEVVKLLLSRGASIELQDTLYGYTPLVWASLKGYDRVVSLLLEKGASIEPINNFGDTALFCACQNGHVLVVSMLLERGASIDLPNIEGYTPLVKASMNGHDALVSLLLDAGASIDLTDDIGCTPLIHASQEGHIDVVSMLLERGANPFITNKKGKTALDAAREKNKSDCVEVLLNYEREREIRKQETIGREREFKDNERTQEMMSSVSTLLQLKDQEILVLQDQLSSREDSLRRSELRILELTNEKKQAIERNNKLEKDLLKEKEKFENQINVFSNRLDSSQSSLEERVRLINVLQSEKKLLEDQVVKLLETNRDQEEQLKEMMKKMETKDQMLVEKETLFTNLRDELSRCESQLETLISEKQQLQEEIAYLQQNSQPSSTPPSGVHGSDESKEVKGELYEAIEELKRDVILKFKQQKHFTLNEQLRKIDRRDPQRRVLLLELNSLNYNPLNTSSTSTPTSGSNLTVESIQQRVGEIYQQLEESKDLAMSDNNLEATLLCDVDRLNFLTFLKVFEVEVKLGEEDNDSKKEIVATTSESNEKDQTISSLQEQIRILNYALTMKEEEMKVKQSIITRYENKQGIGLKTPHVRFLDVEADSNLKDILKSNNGNKSSTTSFSTMKILSGIFHNQDGMDFPCKLKVALCANEEEDQSKFQEQMRKLEREKANLQTIQIRDPHHERSKFLVGWLFPSEFLTDESIYFLDKSGDQIILESQLKIPAQYPPSPPITTRGPRLSQRQMSLTKVMCGLVFESGTVNLGEFLKNQTTRSVPMTQRVHILEQVVEAVRFLHKLEMVHFDLKPENIVLFSSTDSHSTKMRWKLIDFDSSYDEKSSPVLSGDSSNVWLTEEFVCPEVLRALFPSSSYSSPTSKSHSHPHFTSTSNSTSNSNSNSRPHSTSDATSAPVSIPIKSSMDIWSLGMIAFFILTNRTFWSEYSSSDVPFHYSMVTRITQQDIQLTLSRTLKNCEKEKSFVESCLQVNPDDRWDGTGLLEKTLFTTGSSTIQANKMKLTNEVMLERLDEIQRLVRDQNHEQTSLAMSDELSGKFQDFHTCLINEMERMLIGGGAGIGS